MIALVDGDLILYRIGFTTETDSEDIARIRTDELVESILEETGASEYEVWLSDNREGNFRYEIWQDYKANRTQPRPKHYEVIKEHLIKEWGARIAYGMEADDALGCRQSKIYYQGFNEQLNTVICSIDKDLLQVYGEHYNFVRKEWLFVSPWEGLQWFYKQILIGDSSDNVKGCKGIGPVKAGRAVDRIPAEAGEEALFQEVYEVYKKQEKGWSSQEILDHILLVGRLLKIKQKEEEELWQLPAFPKLLQTMDSPKLSSTPPLQEAPIQSTEPTMQESGGGLSALGKQMDTTLKASLPALT